MNAWLDRLTLSQRKLVFLVVAVCLISLGVVSLRMPKDNAASTGASADGPAPPAGAVEAPPVPGGDGAGPAAVDRPVAVEGRNADQEPLAVPDAQLALAQDVAERFAVQYATRRYDESAAARLDRLRPLMSPQLAELFAQDAGGAALEDERRAVREVAVASPELAYPQTVARDRLVFTVVVLQRVTSTQGAQELRPSFQVVVQPAGGGWQVADVIA